MPIQRQVNRGELLQDAPKPGFLPSDQAQIDKDALEKLTAPIQSELAEMCASLRAQASDHRTQVESLKTITTNIDNLHGSVRQLHKQVLAFKHNCALILKLDALVLTSLTCRTKTCAPVAMHARTRSWTKQAR